METFDAEATRARLPFAPLIDALRAAFISGCEVPPRAVHAIVQSDGSPAGHLYSAVAVSGPAAAEHRFHRDPHAGHRGVDRLSHDLLLPLFSERDGSLGKRLHRGDQRRGLHAQFPRKVLRLIENIFVTSEPGLLVVYVVGELYQITLCPHGNNECVVPCPPIAAAVYN